MSDETRDRALAMWELSEARLDELEAELANTSDAGDRIPLHGRVLVEEGRNAVLRELLGKDSRADERRAAQEATDG